MREGERYREGKSKGDVEWDRGRERERVGEMKWEGDKDKIFTEYPKN